MLALLLRGNVYPPAQQEGGAFQNVAEAGPRFQGGQLTASGTAGTPGLALQNPTPHFQHITLGPSKTGKPRPRQLQPTALPGGGFVTEEDDFEITLFWPVRNKSQFLVRG